MHAYFLIASSRDHSLHLALPCAHGLGTSVVTAIAALWHAREVFSFLALLSQPWFLAALLRQSLDLG